MADEPYVNHLFVTLAEYEAMTGNSIDSFNESPMLAAMVENGELPPVEKRLPVDVAVLCPRDEIGQYSGPIKLISFFEGAGAYSQFTENSTQGLLINDPAYTVFHPNVAKSVTQLDEMGLEWDEAQSAE